MIPVSIFIAYSHNDLRYKDELKKFLRPLLTTRQTHMPLPFTMRSLILLLTFFCLAALASAQEDVHIQILEMTTHGVAMPTPVSNIIHPHLVFIKGGTFQMGDQFGEGQSDEKPVHSVTVSDFYMSKTEVTFDEYDAYCAATGAAKPSNTGSGRGKRPVSNVDWYDAVEYCNWLSQKEKLIPAYIIDKTIQDPNNHTTTDPKKWTVTAHWNANGYRLPTEAEWEYAARDAGRKVRFGNGKDLADPSQMNFYAHQAYKKEYSIVGEYPKKTTPVATFAANGLGLFDMSGNVWEWCQNWYSADYYEQSSRATDPGGPGSGIHRCVRGGAWSALPDLCRATNRLETFPYDRASNIGFRVVRH